MTDAPEKFTKQDIAAHINPNCLWVRLAVYDEQQARIAELEAAIATAREDALREAASLCAETGAFAEEMEKPILALIGNEAKP
jgi:hypothetical protein